MHHGLATPPDAAVSHGVCVVGGFLCHTLPTKTANRLLLLLLWGNPYDATHTHEVSELARGQLLKYSCLITRASRDELLPVVLLEWAETAGHTWIIFTCQPG